MVVSRSFDLRGRTMVIRVISQEYLSVQYNFQSES